MEIEEEKRPVESIDVAQVNTPDVELA